MNHSTTLHGPDAIDFPRNLDAARRGSRTAQHALFQDYYPQVERIVHARLRRGLGRGRSCLASRFSTADVVQDVFHSLLRNIRAFAGATRGEFVAYMVKLTHSRLLDTLRHHRASCRDYRRSHGSHEQVPGVEVAPAPAGACTSSGIDVDVQGSYRAALELLPESTQRLLRARIERGLDFEAIAREFVLPSRYAARRAYFAAQARLILRMRAAGSEEPGRGAVLDQG